MTGDPPERRRGLLRRVLGHVFRGLQVAGVLAAGVALFVMLVRAKAPPDFVETEQFALPVAVVAAERGTHAPTITAYGEVIARRSADVRVRVGGPVLRVSERFANGSAVNAGEVLLELDPFEYERRVEETAAAVREAEARLAETRENSRHHDNLVRLAEERRDLTQAEYERQTELAEQNVSARRTLEAAQSRLAEAKTDLTLRRQQAGTSAAQIDQREAILERMRAAAARSVRALEDTRIRAAFDGHLSEVSADVGQQVAAGERIARLIDTTTLEVRFFVPEGRLARLMDIGDGGIGATCIVSWRTESGVRTYTATVTRIEGEIESGRAGINVYARMIDQDVAGDPIRPGAFVEIELYEDAHVGVFRLPANAVHPGPFVLVAVDGVAEPRDVVPVARAFDAVLVEGDLNAGEAVIVTRSAELGAGDAVEVVAQMESSGR